MADSALAAVLFSFDDADASLGRMPIAARRALDLAGWRVALDAWRAMPFEDRRRVTLAGATEIVDPFVVEEAVRRAGSSVMRVRPTPDPDSTRPPTDLATALEPGRTIDARGWSNLRAVERYALVHALRQAPDRAYLHDVFDDIIPPPSTAPAGRGGPASSPPSSLAGAATAADGARGQGSRFVRTSVPPSTIAGPEITAALRPSRDPAPSTVSERPPAPGIPPAPRLPGEMPGSQPPPDGPSSLSSHLTAAGEVHMVDVGAKPVTARRAVAGAAVRMRAETIARVARRDVGKGEVLATARLAGIMAAKRTPELVPLCHHVALTRVEVHLDVDVPARRVLVTAVAEAFDRTGVEMEAMVAASVASLTVYDMLKGIDRDITIESVRLLEKSGGRTGPWRREGT